jgi:outer membrane protein TolC
MMQKTILLFILLSLNLDANIIDFYHTALKSLQYDKSYSLYKQANTASQNGITYNRYANLSVDATHNITKAKLTNSAFSTTDLALQDTIDLFGKRSYNVQALAIDLKSQKQLLDMQKEQLFISLVDMLALYHTTKEQLVLHQELFDEQNSIYKKLNILKQKGAFSNIDLLRFKNTLTSLNLQIISEKNNVAKMQTQLQLYAPNVTIPSLNAVQLSCSRKDFLAHNPAQTYNKLNAKKFDIEAKSAKNSYLPDLTAGIAYQQLGDPTGYGNNYSFNIGLHMPLALGDFKQAQALQANALSLQSKNIEYKIQRENSFTARYQDYLNAVEQLKVLRSNLKDYNKSQKTIKKAFLRQYVDFNTYLQVLTQTLSIKEQIIQVKYNQTKEAVILNNIGSGAVYE